MIRGNQILLGQIIKVVSYDGTVAVKLSQQRSDNFRDSEPVFIETEGKMVPFFVSEFAFSGEDIIRLKFDGYESDVKVSEFVRCNIYQASAADTSESENEEEAITGYTAFMKSMELIGTVTGMVKNPGQWLMTVITPGHKEILIPYHNDFIVRTDNVKKIIILDPPEGLIDIN